MTGRILYLLLHSPVVNLLFWLKCVKKSLPHTGIYLEKGRLCRLSEIISRIYSSPPHQRLLNETLRTAALRHWERNVRDWNKKKWVHRFSVSSLCSLVYMQRLMGNKICWRSVDFEPWIWCFQSLPTRAKMGSENRALDREDICHFSCVPFLCIFGTCTLILYLYSGN